MGEWVKDVTDASFDREVVEQSQRVPVVIDFWAPWCAPCRALGPVLERLADEYAGAFVLAKINVDESPGAATAFGIHGIPAVKAVHGGEVVDEFVGALAEPAVRQFLGRILPSDSDRLAEEGRRRALEFAWPRVVDRIEQVYRDAAGRRAAAQGTSAA